jgi:hypothetical protein
MVITQNSKYCVGIVTRDEEYFELQAYDLITAEQLFKKEYHGKYLKMNLVEQTTVNNPGEIIAVCRQDNGKFAVEIISLKEAGKTLAELDVNPLVALDDKSKPVTGFYEPLSTCAFLENNDLMVTVFHRF